MARSGGRIPKRSSERRRRNKDSQPEKVQAQGIVKAPGLPRGIHPIARRWYNSLKQSGQAQYYEPSDWAKALLTCEVITRLLANETRISAQLLAVVDSMMESLLTSEASRRRARVEVERMTEEPSGPNVSVLDQYRKELGA